MRLSVPLLGLLLLTACSTQRVEIRPTIAMLAQEKSIEQAEPAVTFKINKQQLINNYRTVIDLGAPDDMSQLVLKRLADLELDTGLAQQLDDNKTAEQGEKTVQLAIQRYEQYLKSYPADQDNDVILYQLAKAYDMNGQIAKAQQQLRVLIEQYPQSIYRDEALFRRGEYLFVLKQYKFAQQAYQRIVEEYPQSSYFEKALYKLAWSQFKQNNNEAAIADFLKLLDIQYQRQNISQIALNPKQSRAEKELNQDILRVLSLSLSYLAVPDPLDYYFSRRQAKPYMPLLYSALGQQFQSNKRLIDAANTYLAYASKYRLQPHAPDLYQKAIAIYQQAGYTALLLKAKKNYIAQFNKGSEFWLQQTESTQKLLAPQLLQHINDLAQHYHAIAKTSKKVKDFLRAAQWYRLALESFATANNAVDTRYLLAESLFDAKQYLQAAQEYDLTAYQYPVHKHSADAAYAVIISHNKRLQHSKKSEQASVLQAITQSSERFVKSFSKDERAVNVRLNLAEHWYAQKQYQKAIQMAEKLTVNESAASKQRQFIQQKRWRIIAHSYYELQQYQQAEIAYLKLLQYLPVNKKYLKERQQIQELVATVIYKQGEQARQQQQHAIAALHFERLGQSVPNSPKRIIADYDAATAYLAMKQWDKGIRLLKTFRQKYPKQKRWAQGVSEKLAYAYMQKGDSLKAAKEMLTLFTQYRGEDQRQILLQAARLFEENGEQKQAMTLYKRYVKKYPKPISQRIELQHKLALHYQQQKQNSKYRYWLQQIINTDRNAGNQRDNRTRYLAAMARLELTKPLHQQYSAIQLKIPLKKSLKQKKRAMQKVLKAYGQAAKYQIAEVTTQATDQIAQVYNEFAKALLNSERPRNLNEDELEEYNYLLEDQAFPFEEKAIKIYESNVAKMAQGNFDVGIKNSLKALAVLLPYRYDKTEKLEQFVE